VRALIDAVAQNKTSEIETVPTEATKTRSAWIETEHDKFLRVLELYDHDWKRIETHAKLRTAAQIRLHAQKYFQKTLKSKNSMIGRRDDVTTLCDANYVQSASESMRVPELERYAPTDVGNPPRERRAMLCSGFVYRSRTRLQRQ
tara:strand:+ start:117 stop:551 length:435 start_codon:yes stop_codon:yes gene_type:complete